jgi:iron-sulfur cluster repair protein YtfE (RIC family)
MNEALIMAKANNCQPEEMINWNVIKLMVDKYTERHPEEVVGAIEYVKKLKSVASDRTFGVQSKETGMRHIMEMPSALMAAMEFKYPTVFKDGNMLKFARMFPCFIIPEKL